MRKVISGLATALTALVLLSACATSDPLAEGPTSATSPVAALQLEPPIQRAYLPDIRDWRAVDRSYLVLWRSRNHPFLVLLRQPLTSSEMASFSLSVRRQGSYLTPFDHVIIDGWRHDIDRIWAITREQAESLTGRGRTADDV